MKLRVALTAAAIVLTGPVAMAHMPDQCLDQMRKMNTWIAPKKADAQRLGKAGERLSRLVPVKVRLALAKGESVPSDWTPNMNELAGILDTLGSASSSYLTADQMFVENLGELLTCIARGSN